MIVYVWIFMACREWNTSTTGMYVTEGWSPETVWLMGALCSKWLTMATMKFWNPRDFHMLSHNLRVSVCVHCELFYLFILRMQILVFCSIHMIPGGLFFFSSLLLRFRLLAWICSSFSKYHSTYIFSLCVCWYLDTTQSCYGQPLRS